MDWKKSIHLDLRSLALFRIGLALLLLYDLLSRSLDLVAHYTSQGVLPLNPLKSEFAESYFWSFHFLGDSPVFQGILFLLAAAFALLLLLGYHTRLMTLLSWLFLCSLQMRNPLILQFGDVVLRVLLFWSLFLPLGTLLSIDRLRSSQRTNSQYSILSGGSFAFILQVAFIYWFTVLLKTEPEWWREGTAVFYALRFESLATPIGLWLSGFPIFTRLLTYGTIGLEILAPLLILTPVATGPFRTLAILSMILFHLGLALSINLGIFPWACILAWLALLPSWFWKKIIPWEGNLPRFTDRWKQPKVTQAPKIRIPRWANVFAVLLIFYLFIWNLRTVYFDWVAAWFPYQLNRVGEVLRLEQRWGMYAPRPTLQGGWLVIPGRLSNGENIDLIRRGKKISWDKPPNVAESLINDRWGNYLTRLWDPDYSQYRTAYGKYLCREWNESHPQENQLTSLEIYLQRQTTRPYPKEPHVEKIFVFKYECTKS